MSGAKRISIVDIARALDVSITTVSFILNGKAEEKRISDALTRRVKDYVEQVGYKPNELAASLRSGKSRIIALMVEDIANPFFARIAREIEQRAFEEGYKILYCSTDNDPARTETFVRVFKDRRVDGYIIAPPPGSEAVIENLLQEGYPVVLFDRYLSALADKPGFQYVGINNREMAAHSVHRLHQAGYQHIAFVTIESGQTQMEERYQGYFEAIQQCGLPVYTLSLPFQKIADEAVKEAALHEFLSANPALDALFFATNYLGMAGLKELRKRKINIPKEMGVVVFDEHDVFEFYKPGIAVVEQPLKELAKATIQLLLKQLTGKSSVKSSSKASSISSSKSSTKISSTNVKAYAKMKTNESAPTSITIPAHLKVRASLIHDFSQWGIGADVGGTHITAALVHLPSGACWEETVLRSPVRSRSSVDHILQDWGAVLAPLIQLLREAGAVQPVLGMAMPGPFDYKEGVAWMKGQDKYDALYGLSVRELLADFLTLPAEHISFENDAACFLLGELMGGTQTSSSSKAIGITLGTGLGSAWFDGIVAVDADLWKIPFKDSIAEDYISTRWFTNWYKKNHQTEHPNLLSILQSENNETVVENMFLEFAQNLRLFIDSFLKKYPAELLILGGNITKACDRFLPHLQQQLDIPIHCSTSGEFGALKGALHFWQKKLSKNNKILAQQ